MLKLGFEPEKVFLFCKKSFLPELLAGMFLVYFFTVSEFSESAYQTTHLLFVITVALALLVAAFFRIMPVMAAVSIIYVSYIVISAERYLYGEDYIFFCRI